MFESTVATRHGPKSKKGRICSQEEALVGHIGGSEATSSVESIDDEVVGVLELVESLCRTETAV